MKNNKSSNNHFLFNTNIFLEMDEIKIGKVKDFFNKNGWLISLIMSAMAALFYFLTFYEYFIEDNLLIIYISYFIIGTFVIIALICWSIFLLKKRISDSLKKKLTSIIQILTILQIMFVSITLLLETANSIVNH